MSRNEYVSRLGMSGHLCLRVLVWRDVNGTRTLCVSRCVTAHVCLYACVCRRESNFGFDSSGWVWEHVVPSKSSGWLWRQGSLMVLG